MPHLIPFCSDMAMHVTVVGSGCPWTSRIAPWSVVSAVRIGGNCVPVVLTRITTPLTDDTTPHKVLGEDIFTLDHITSNVVWTRLMEGWVY